MAMDSKDTTPLPPEVRARAEALVRKYFAQCFWSWKVDAGVATVGQAAFVVQHLREFGGREGWREAATLRRCL